MRGQHILIFARPETGKSLFSINMVRGFLEDGYRVLYLGNEDPSTVMRTRMGSCILNIPTEDIRLAATGAFDEELTAGGADNFIFIHLEPGTFPQIRGLCRRIEPDILVVDQIRNIQTGGDGLTSGQEKAGIEMRNIAGEFDLLAISIAQAGESAQDKLVLGLSDIDSSKTGLPAQVDLMVGIGITEEYQRRSKRMISTPKNKLSGNHEFFSVTVNEATSRVVE